MGAKGEGRGCRECGLTIERPGNGSGNLRANERPRKKCMWTGHHTGTIHHRHCNLLKESAFWLIP